MSLTAESALRKDRTRPSGDAMQHRHFAVIADIIAKADFRPHIKAEIARTFADRLRATNPKFDRARFLRACEIEEA